MRILHISNKPIFPLIDGGCKAMNQTLNSLMRLSKVKHICLSTYKHPFNKKDYPKDILNEADVETIYVETKLNFFKAFVHLLFNISYNFSRFYSNRANAIIQKKILEEKFDLIVLDNLYACAYIDTIKNKSTSKIIYRSHNVEHIIWERLYKKEQFLFKRLYLKILSKQLKKIELKILKKVDAVWSISNTDSLYLLNKTLSLSTIPMALNFHDKKLEYSNKDLFFIGSYNWSPNIDAVTWLCNVLLPKLHEKDSNVVLHIAGSYSDEIESKLTYSKNIIFHGFVKDSNEFMINNGIFVMPIRTGSGVRVKALEAMSLSVPIIASEMALEGVDCENSFLKAKGIDDWLEKIHLLRSSESMRRDISKNAYSYVKSTYNKDEIDKLIKKELEKILA
ncbi:MAG: glycosyltransferase [Crocinitomicaceae bacterium]|nr:glycosyltransferase [Crocinitomicaceae bacterium]